MKIFQTAAKEVKKTKSELQQIRDRIRKTIDDSRVDNSQLSHIRLRYGHIPEMEGMEDFMATKTSFAFSQGPISYNSRRLHARNKEAYAESLRSSSPQKNPSVNVGLRERDTFLSIFPGYGVTRDRFDATSRSFHAYPEKQDDGKPTHEIKRDFHHKVDFMKRYTESMLKVKHMRRVIP